MKSWQNNQYGQLFWWRENPNLHTLITLWGYPLAALNQIESFKLTFVLFDVNGNFQTCWERSLNKKQCIFWDSATCCETQLNLTEGVLAVFVEAVNASIDIKPSSLYSIIDWYSESGEIVTLHSDQLIHPNNKSSEWTEIVIRETSTAQNSLVVINGSVSQPENSITLEIQNHLGKTLETVYQPQMNPFSIHKLKLRELFPNLLDFADGNHVTVTGKFTSKGVFIRPYVVTEDVYLSGYHGGDRYSWQGLPAIAYRYMGKGEVNPMMALHQKDLTTTVNLLNTHGDLEQDFWVDAYLYDETGKLVTKRDRWLLAGRNRLNRGEIQDLLPDNASFVGHVALNFSQDEHDFYPRRLQALMEYRTTKNTARVMAWSDVWNWRDRQKYVEDLTYVAYFRVWCKSPLISYISLTNCGIDPDYELSLEYTLRLQKEDGESLSYCGAIPPQGTIYQPVTYFFPEIKDFLGDRKVALVVIETKGDIASMHLSHNQNSGVYGAEHFLPAPIYYQDRFHFPCGS